MLLHFPESIVFLGLPRVAVERIEEEELCRVQNCGPVVTLKLPVAGIRANLNGDR